MKIFICLLAFLVTVNSLPNPAAYKESVGTHSLDKYGLDHVKSKFSSFDFDKSSKLEFGDSSSVAGTSDIGPKDVAAELHAKIEEAAQHALAIIDGAKTFAEEAEKEQVLRHKKF